MNLESQQLQKKLDTTFNILLELEYMKQGSLDVSNQSSKYFEKSSSKSQFLNTTFKAYTRLIIIDLYKLIDPKSHYNLLKTVNFCKTNIDKINWHSKMELNTLEQLEKKLVFEEKVFEDIKNLRDKYYAHSDRNRFDYTFNIEPTDLWKVLDNLQYVFRIICANYSNIQWIFNIQYKGTKELRMISKYVEMTNFIRNSKVAGTESISIEDLEKITRN